MHIYKKYINYYQYSPTRFGASFAIFTKYNNSFEHTKEFLSADGAISAETCRRVLIIIHVFYNIRAFCWCTKGVIAFISFIKMVVYFRNP
jgi:hypothetical protein